VIRPSNKAGQTAGRFAAGADHQHRWVDRMRSSLILALPFLLGSCVTFQSNVSYDELVGQYHASFVADGNTLKVHHHNPGGLNIASLASFSRDDCLFVGAARRSSGPAGWRWVSLDVTDSGLGSDWHERVYWLHGSEPIKVDVPRAGGQLDKPLPRTQQRRAADRQHR